MAPEQAASTPPETESYDADFMKDVSAAYSEVAKDVPADTPAETKPEAAPTEPTKETAEPRADHPTDPKRYADGTFKPTTEDAKPAEVKTPQVEAPKADQPKTADTGQVNPPTAPTVTAPPPGWSVKSKAEWDKLPEHIRADIAKREQEVNAGFAQYTGLKPVLKYAEMARQRGTTLEAALDRYVGIENLLSQNLLGGILHIAGNAGIQPQQLAHALAQHVGMATQQSAEGQQPQPAYDPNALRQFINPLEQRLSRFEQLFTQREEGALNSAVQRFGADPANRYFENVRPLMHKLFNGGFIQETGDVMADLKTAYDQACQLDQDVREQLINERIAATDAARRQSEKDALEKAKNASRSIAGSSTSSVNSQSDADEPLEETVRKAFRAHAA